MSRDSKEHHFTSPEVRVVEASAGSGKTYALAKRYTQLVLNAFRGSCNIPIKNILAITFTNKASFEMKSRILEFLKMIALKQLPDDQAQEIIAPLGLDYEQASRRAFGIMEQIVRHYNYFQVETIDKFINALLSGCAFRIGLTANFQIRTNAQDYLQYSLDELIDGAGKNKDIQNIFSEFLHNYLYLENRTGWFPKQDMLSILVSLFGQNSSYGLGFSKSGYGHGDLLKKKIALVKDIKKLKGLLPPETNKTFLKSIDKFIEKSAKGFDIDSVSNTFAKDEAPLNKGANETGELRKQWQKIKKDLRLLSEEEASSLFDPYVEIFAKVMDGFNALKERDDCLFLSELNKQASLLFENDYITVEELYYRLATRFEHYLIDEFQDTSRLQWRNLDAMVEEALSTGGTLFYVGDRKQAIYGFRGGDVSLFDDVKKRFHAFNVTTEQLSKNWRSQKAIVDANNCIFSKENLHRFLNEKYSSEIERKKKDAVAFDGRDLERLDAVFNTSNQDYLDKNDRGHVQFEFIDEDSREERDEVIHEKVIAQIKELTARFAFKDIAFLTRTNKEVELLTGWLLEEGLPVESERTSNIQEQPLIEELINFLRFLDSPIDNLSIGKFILGDIFSTATGIQKSEIHEFVFGLRDELRSGGDFYLYRAFREKYREVWDEFIDGFFKNVGLYPLYELVLSIYNKYEVLMHFPQVQGFFMHFLELIKENEAEIVDIQDFLNYFENLLGNDLFVHVTGFDAIKVLTVHKSKGLEFPVVIVPFLAMDIQIGTGTENNQSFVLRELEGGNELLKLKGKYYLFSEHLKAIYEDEYKKAMLSELNNLYVALTRPEFELYAYIPKKVGSSKNPVRLLIPEECYEMGTKHKYEREGVKRENVNILPASQYRDWFDYLKEEFSDQDKLIHRQPRLEGEVYHLILSYIGNLSIDDRSEMIQKAKAEIEAQFPELRDFDRYFMQVDKLLAQENIKPFFYVEQSKVFNEKEVVTASGLTRRIDRMVISSDAVRIIDYKSREEANEDYLKQVAEYKSIVKEIYPDKEISGFLIFLDTGKVQNVK